MYTLQAEQTRATEINYREEVDSIRLNVAERLAINSLTFYDAFALQTNFRSIYSSNHSIYHNAINARNPSTYAEYYKLISEEKIRMTRQMIYSKREHNGKLPGSHIKTHRKSICGLIRLGIVFIN